MADLSKSQLKARPRYCIEKEQNNFLLIRRTGDLRAGDKDRTTAWPMKAAEQLRCQHRILSALSLVAETTTGGANWEKAFRTALAKVGQAANVSRVYLFENSRSNAGRILMSLRYEWVASGIEARKDSPDFQNLPYDSSDFGRWASALSRRKPILEEMVPTPVDKQAKRLAIQGVKAVALAPIFANNHWWDFIGLDECRSDQRHFDSILDILKIAAALVGAAIERNRLANPIAPKGSCPGNKSALPGLSAPAPYRFGEIIGQSKAMQRVYDFILQAAATDAGVIIYGESGTGKELVARAIHKSGRQSSNRFVAVNCGAIPEPILESEFFGYKNGAFTGAIKDKQGILDQADGGTLFLDEVGELTVNMQVKLLRAIEGGGYTPLGGRDLKKPNFRIIAATNKDLKTLVKEAQIRDDFFYRIHVISIQLPPLRDRQEDIPILVAHFLRQYGKNGNKRKVSARSLETLSAYRWPGNVRELQNVLHRYVTLGELELSQHFHTCRTADNSSGQPNGHLADAINSFERRFIRQVLADTCWHRGRTASALGICRKTLQRKIKRHGLDRKIK